MLDAQYVDEYSDCVEEMWDLVDSRIPHTTANIRNTEKYAMQIGAVMEQCVLQMTAMSRTIASILEMADGCVFSREDMRLIRLAIINEVVCAQISGLRDYDLCDLADRDMEMACQMSRLMVKENEYDEPAGEDGDVQPQG